jgi:hypothetical protein
MRIDQCLQASPLYKLHCDIEQSTFFASVEDHDDIGVRQQARSAGLGLESADQFFARQSRARLGEPQGLNRNVSANYRIESVKHDTHGAATQFFTEIVASCFG